MGLWYILKSSFDQEEQNFAVKDSELRIKFLKFNMKMVIFFFASKNEQDFPKKAHKIPKLKKGSDILEHHLDIWRLMVLLR